MLKFIFYGFLIYFLYKVIFELVIPATKVTKEVKNKMAEMQEAQRRQQYAAHQQQQAAAAQQKQATTTKPVEKEYIDFEEIK